MRMGTPGSLPGQAFLTHSPCERQLQVLCLPHAAVDQTHPGPLAEALELHASERGQGRAGQGPVMPHTPYDTLAPEEKLSNCQMKCDPWKSVGAGGCRPKPRNPPVVRFLNLCFTSAPGRPSTMPRHPVALTCNHPMSRSRPKQEHEGHARHRQEASLQAYTSSC